MDDQRDTSFPPRDSTSIRFHIQDTHRQRALDLLTFNEPTCDDDHRTVEGGGLRSSYWSPDHEFENDIPPVARSSLAQFGERFSKRITSSIMSMYEPEFWNKFKPAKRKPVGWRASFKALVTSSFLNALLIFIPMAWVLGVMKPEGKIAHYHTLQFCACFLSIIPLCTLLEFAGENLALYCEKDFGDLIVITSSNVIEAILALCLLGRCELKLLQATTVGVVLLRLLLIPGIVFLIQGYKVETQELHPHVVELNQSLLFTSVLFLTLPVSFFAALDRGSKVGAGGGNDVVSDKMRGELLKVSRGMAILLIIIYVCSRYFIHRPGKSQSAEKRDDPPDESKKVVAHMAEEEPEMNVWLCAITLVLAVGLLAVCAEFLVESIEPMREHMDNKEEFFGLILLPIVSFSGDALVAIVFFIRSSFFKSQTAETPKLANYRSIESSIQFILLWTPCIVILGWCYHRPLSLLYDFYEMAILLGATFLVNYVTADAKTNWVEGCMLMSLYIMISLTTWFYPGQPEIVAMMQCNMTVAEYLATAPPIFIASPLGDSPTHASTHVETNAAHQVHDAHTRAILEDQVMSDKLQALLDLYDVLAENDEL